LVLTGDGDLCERLGRVQVRVGKHHPRDGQHAQPVHARDLQLPAVRAQHSGQVRENGETSSQLPTDTYTDIIYNEGLRL